MAAKAKTEQITFEEALSELEKIAEKLERGQLTLEESIQSYERGMELKKVCQSILKDAEGKIEYLSRNQSGEIEAKNAKKETESKDDKEGEDLF